MELLILSTSLQGSDQWGERGRYFYVVFGILLNKYHKEQDDIIELPVKQARIYRLCKTVPANSCIVRI
jgi:hypothetical protein